MNKYERLSIDRKQLQRDGQAPEWMTTAGFQLMKSRNYLMTSETPLGLYTRVAKRAAELTRFKIPSDFGYPTWNAAFNDVLWRGWLSPSTPGLTNLGNTRGHPISCSGSFVGDSIRSFYETRMEIAQLTQRGYGTSVCLDPIRPRGSDISHGGKANGVMQLAEGIVQDMREISQGCYDDQTEVLTENGWMLFNELLQNRHIKVAQVLDDKTVEYVSPTDYIKYGVDEKLLHFKDSKNINLLVTKNHNMVFERQRESRTANGRVRYMSNELEMITADELKFGRDTFMCSAADNDKDFSGLSARERFLIAYQADGSNIKNNKTACRFRLKKQRKVRRLDSILDELDYVVTKTTKPDGVTEYYIQTSVKNSKVLDWVDLSKVTTTYAREFVDEVLMWDGDQKSSYCSIIAANVDVVQSVAVLGGIQTYISTLSNREGCRKDLHRITFKRNRMHFGTEKLKAVEKHYKGFVYCVTVPTHRLIVRRGGRTLVCGNSARRGQAGIYLNPLHADFDEVSDRLLNDDDGFNIGWNITDEFEELFFKDPERADYIWKRMLKIKATKGKGYFFFVDKANRLSPQMYKDRGFKVRASQLCSEISLMNDKDHTYSCALSSVNVSKYDEWKDTKLIQIATVFIDALIEDMLIKARGEVGFERIIAFTEKSRAQGLGVLGQSTYYQQQDWVFGDFQSTQFNISLFKELNRESLAASRLMAKEVGEPDWMKGYGERCSHRMAVAPTMSTSTIMGGISLGIEPTFANVYEQDTAGGTVYRINPPLLLLMKERGVYSEATMRRIAEDQGSVQAEDWLSDHEKQVYLTAFEVNQESILRMAAQRQPNIDQGQSTNLYFTATESEEEISRIHDIAFKDPFIQSLYYLRSLNSAMKQDVDKSACVACEG